MIDDPKPEQHLQGANGKTCTVKEFNLMDHYERLAFIGAKTESSLWGNEKLIFSSNHVRGKDWDSDQREFVGEKEIVGQLTAFAQWEQGDEPYVVIRDVSLGTYASDGVKELTDTWIPLDDLRLILKKAEESFATDPYWCPDGEEEE